LVANLPGITVACCAYGRSSGHRATLTQQHGTPMATDDVGLAQRWQSTCHESRSSRDSWPLVGSLRGTRALTRPASVETLAFMSDHTQRNQIVGRAIRLARRSAGLTQAQLGLRLGLKPRAIMWWETAQSAPSRPHRRQMLLAIQMHHAAAAATLGQAFDTAFPPRLHGQGARAAAIATATTTATAPPPEIPAKTKVELFIARAADDLDVTSKRLLGVLVRLHEALAHERVSPAQLVTEVAALRQDKLP
jgi:DNA-binding transcriptional regulator YiaG